MAASGGQRTARSRIKSSTNTNENEILRLRHHLRKDGRFTEMFNANIKVLLGVSVLSFVIVLFIIYHITKPIDDAQKLFRVITPFPAPKLMDLPQFEGEHKEALYWGTYRPQVYLGIHARCALDDDHEYKPEGMEDYC